MEILQIKNDYIIRCSDDELNYWADRYMKVPHTLTFEKFLATLAVLQENIRNRGKNGNRIKKHNIK